MLLFISILFQLLLLYHSSLVYKGTRKLNLGSNNIVWSDSRYVQLYGDRYSFIVDLQTNFDRFRNIANKTQANMTLYNAFRARGRTYEKSLQPKCSFENTQSHPIHPKFITDSNITYFALQGESLILGVFSDKCQFSSIDFSKPQPSLLKQVYRIDDFYLGIRTQKTLYIINKQTSQITQQLDLTICQTLNNNSQLKFTTNYYVSIQSLKLIITSKDGICIYQKLSKNANFNFIKQHKSYLNQYPSFAQINDSVAFITTNNCTQIKLNLQNAKNSISPKQTQLLSIRDNIVGTADYTKYWSRYDYPQAHIYLQSGEDLYLQSNLIEDQMINNVSAPILSACGGNYNYDTYITFALDADGIKLHQPSKILNSVKDYKFDKIGCFTSKLKQGSEYPVFAAGITNNELTVAYIQGRNDGLFDTYKTNLPQGFKVNSVLVGASYAQITDKYNYFFIVLTNTETNKLTCLSFLANNSKIALVGRRDINTTQFITADRTSILWHEIEGGKHIIKELTSTLQIIKYDIGLDYKSIQPIHFCYNAYKCFRVIRTSGRVDIYMSSPYQSSRVASYYQKQSNEELFSVYNLQTITIYIEYSDKSTTTTLNISSMFYSRTIALRPLQLCQKSILQPIFASPQRVYSIFISVVQNESKQQQIKIIRTYYEPYYGYYYDNSSYITLSYNSTINFKIISYRYFQKQNTLVSLLIPSYDPTRRVLTGIKLDFLSLINDYMIWDWIIQMSPSTKILSYELDQSSLIVMQQNGKMSRYQPNGVSIQKTPNGISDQKLPYLISKSGNIVAYYGYYSGFIDKTIFADSITGETFYLMNSYNFMAISPSGLLLAQKNQLNPYELNIYKRVDLLGRIKLTKAINKNSKVWFMAENIILQIEISGSRVELYLFSFKEDPFIYTPYSFASNQGTKRELVSFNEVNVAVGLSSKILVLDRKLNTVQTLSTSFVENGAPQSVSMAEGGNVYAKVNNLLYIWKSGECPDGLSNNDGVCGDGGSGDVSSGQLAGIIGGSVGGAVLVAGSILFIRRWKKRKGLSLLESQGANAHD